ncbi:peptide chain release factor N(5)-glutamine methyltransferase [Echinicola strongylocentroti]|uniref:Release factor glutamine methyltransferase n=1 Tax=Echinicola strongylocentroti TaxID=1795355 RepID=A0A2Z4IJ94_9BACT|nr:peptide chain release factor N(5)-glutamine methyltransferase [Echinicola strongylocentroti]AWW31034.1 peptide chain release factor N(5)-glutamine methyltransferase [Echinicola strongylocentroti]
MNSSRNLYQSIVDRLKNSYPETETQSLAFWMLEHFLQVSRGDIIRDKELQEIPQALHAALEELQAGKPIQYILGEAPFYGRDFKVNPSVLIPRNETEELVHLIIKENPYSGLRILDIGTGSGCIPITLYLEMADPLVTAIDISEHALQTAKENASIHDAKVSFIQTDILSGTLPISDLDILVSNPPYVRELEKAQMHKNVLEYEPSLALFVSNADPLIFYRTITSKGLDALKPDGKLYFEINEALASEMEELVSELGYQNIKVHQDLQGKDRILSAQKK